MQLRYVKTLEEVRALQKLYAAPAFERRIALLARYETEPDVIAALLPPPLEPTEHPIASVSVGHIRASNCLEPFTSCTLAVEAQYQGEVGSYAVTMAMSTDNAVIFGRELYGEPKKVADIRLERRGDAVSGTVTRHGITYIEIRATVGEPIAPAEGGSPALPGRRPIYYFKYMPAPDGDGFDHDPLLVRVRGSGRTRSSERCEGDVILRESAHDPVVDIPVRRLLDITLTEGDSYPVGEIVTSVPGESLLPYMFGRVDAWDLLAKEAEAVASGA